MIGGFFLAFATTLQPFYNAAGAYSASGTNTLEGEESPVYAASFGMWSFSSELINKVMIILRGCTTNFCSNTGFFLLFKSVLSFIFSVCSVRTNVCLLLIFTGAFVGFALLTGSFWNLAKGNLLSAGKLQTVSITIILADKS